MLQDNINNEVFDITTDLDGFSSEFIYKKTGLPDRLVRGVVVLTNFNEKKFNNEYNKEIVGSLYLDSSELGENINPEIGDFIEYKNELYIINEIAFNFNNFYECKIIIEKDLSKMRSGRRR